MCARVLICHSKLVGLEDSICVLLLSFEHGF